MTVWPPNCLRYSIVLFLTIFLLKNSRADDYRLHPSPTFTTGTAHVVTPYSKASDDKVCQTYLENLRYFARLNTPMSCERPIAPSLEKIIQPVAWETLDPVANENTLKSILSLAPFGVEKDPKTLEYRKKEIKSGVRVFRRINMVFSGFFDNGNHRPKPWPDSFQIVQYGINLLDKNPNSENIWRCTPRRGGPKNDYSYYLKLYLVSPDLKEVYGELSNYASGGPTGSHLKLIREKLYVEHVTTSGDSILMEMQTNFPIGLFSICSYLFKNTK